MAAIVAGCGKALIRAGWGSLEQTGAENGLFALYIETAFQAVFTRDRLSSHSSMRLRHKTSCGSSPRPPHNRDNPLST